MLLVGARQQLYCLSWCILSSENRRLHQRQDTPPSISIIKFQLEFMSEVLRPEVRRVYGKAWGAAVYDTYSTEETGYIALQCPESNQLLVQPEGVYAEFLDPSGRDCGAGEVGNVIVAPLNNFAMPLLRYEVGDYAEIGGESACGRQCQVIERVIGCTRNLVRLPDGRTHFPDYQGIHDGFDHVVQFQIIRRRKKNWRRNWSCGGSLPVQRKTGSPPGCTSGSNILLK